MNSSCYNNPEELTIVDLEDSICLGMRGDLSYILSSSLWLYEEQSSWNPNMPLRMLFQISDIYKSLINKRQLYRSSQIILKNPHFITFYCGDTKYLDSDEIELRLSDSYEKEEVSSELELELKVRIININKGYNESLLKACESLRGYACLNEKVKEYKIKGMDIDAAVSSAIKYCIENSILADFLLKYQEEVAIMLGQIYTFEDFKQDMKEEYDALKEERDEIKEECDELKEERDAIKEERDVIKEECDALRNKFAAQEEYIKSLEKQLKDAGK